MDTTTTTESKTRTITLTGRPPVKIKEDEWPVVAEAIHQTWDGEFRFQAFRKTDWIMKVRQHSDGRLLVYGIYCHDTAYQGEKDLTVRRGILLRSEDICGVNDLPNAIQTVAAELESEVKDGVFARLGHECVADLPAEEI